VGPSHSDKWVPVTVISGSLSPRHGAFSGCGRSNGFQIWKVAANILNKHSRTADKGWSFSLELGEVLTTPLRQKLNMLRHIQRNLGQGQVVDSCECDDEHSGSIKCKEVLASQKRL
jgi:hypothetical protein